MDDFYSNGVKLAFVLGMTKIVISLNALFSQGARNLKRIGLHYSLMQGNFVSKTPVTFIHFVFFTFYLLVLAPIFSWFSVVSAAWGIISMFTKRSEVPDNVREIQYKIANMDLTQEQMVSLQAAIGKTLPVAEGSPTEEDDDPFTLVLDPGEWYEEVCVDPKNKTLNFYSHTPDFDSVFHSKYEYRFEKDRLECRMDVRS